MSGDTACGSMSSWNWCSVPSCQQQWYPQLPMGNYVLVPQKYHFVCACAVEIPAKTVVGQVAPANQILLVVHPTRTAEGTNT